MGIDRAGIQALDYARKNNVSLNNVATIGRQGIYIKPNFINKILKQNTIKPITPTKENGVWYAEELFKKLGAKNIDSFDYSDYENATVIHDMNIPIPEQYKNTYDFVFDGGTLEHVFNFPTAIKNCMEMVSVGGYFMSVTPTNNFSGHGFYQFSPELFFRIFGAGNTNGFELIGIFMSANDTWYKVSDPAAIHGRVTFRNYTETSLIVLAKKTEQKNIFEKTPQQSDYIEIGNNKPKQISFGIGHKIIQKIRHLWIRHVRIYDPNFFKKIK